jgi:hypothetical protein
MTISPARIAGASVAFAILLVGLQSCTRRAEQPLPEGPQTMSGVLVPVPLSLSRRGTHALTQGGTQTYYVESTKQDLRNFEGVDVIISGLFERNSDPDALPVLVASGVKLVDMPVKSWSYESLGITLETPSHWLPQEFDDGVQFTQTGSTQVLLKIHPSVLTQLPAGTMLQVAGRKATRVSGSGEQTVYVLNGRTILSFSYQPPVNAPLTAAERDFNRVLRSVKFSASSSSVSSRAAGTGSVQTGTGGTAGVPCGGAAGVLCPSGQYCEITDTAEGIGRCRSL